MEPRSASALGDLTSAEKYIIKSRLEMAFWKAEEGASVICSAHRAKIVQATNLQACSVCGKKRSKKLDMYIITYRWVGYSRATISCHCFCFLHRVLFQDVCRVLHDQRTVPLHRPACVLQLQGKELERSRFQQQLHSARSGSPSTPANVRRNCPSFESGEWGRDADRGCPAPASTQETSDSEGNYSSSGRRLTLFWFKSR